MRRSDINIDHAALVALGAITVGWFLMATLVADFGPWKQSIRFYEVWAVIRDPAGRLSGVNRSGALAVAGFVLICALALVAALTPMYSKRQSAWLCYLIPLTLMAVSLAALYTSTSTKPVDADGGAHSVSAYLAHIAQAAVSRAADTVATHISVGAGVYVALLGSCYLALRGVRKFRAAAARRDGIAVPRL